MPIAASPSATRCARCYAAAAARPAFLGCLGAFADIPIAADQTGSIVFTLYWPGAALYKLDDSAPERLLSESAGSTLHDFAASSPKIPFEANALYVDADTPAPDQNAGSIHALNLMRLLRDFGFRIFFVPESNFAANTPTSCSNSASTLSTPTTSPRSAKYWSGLAPN